MRSNWNSDLLAYTRASPQRARVMSEVAIVTLEDKIATKSEWSAADSLTGVTVLDNGGVRITGTGGTLIENTTTSSDFSTALDRVSPVRMGRIRWDGHPDDFAIEKVTCYLDPDTGAGKEVEEWVLVLYALESVKQASYEELVLVEIAQLRETAGVAAGDVEFDFSDLAYGKPRPNAQQPRHENTNAYPSATSFFQILAVKSDGYASAVSWKGGGAAVVTGGSTLDGVELTALPSDGLPYSAFTKYYRSATLAPPRIKIVNNSFTAKTVAFTTNPLDLTGATGTVEFAIEGNTPRGTSLTGQVRNDADTGWVTFQDGDLIDDLAGVSLPATRGRGDYEVQVLLGTDGDATPTAKFMALREVELEDVSNVTDVDGRWACDPQTLEGELPRFDFKALHTGQRDFYDAWTRILSENDINDMTIRLWWGHQDLARSKWMRLDDVIIEATEGLGPQASIRGFSPLALLKTVALPVYDKGAGTWDPLVYTNYTLKAATEDLRDNQLGLADRFVGPGIEDNTTQVSKTIQDSDVKTEMDAIAALAGGVWSSSQGRLKFFDLHGDKAIVVFFPPEAIDAIEVTPGFEARQPEFFVDYKWDVAAERYDGLLYRQHADALAALGTLALRRPQHIDPEIAKYITTAPLATAVAQRQVDSFGAGFIRMRIRSNYAYPELEIGDLVAVATEQFILKDPLSARAIRGWAWANAVVISNDVKGRDLALWVRRFSDIVSSATDATTTVGFYPFRATVYHASDQSMGTSFPTILAFDSETEDVGSMHDTVTNNSRLTIPTAGDGTYEIKVKVDYDTFGFTPNKDVFVDIYKNGTTVLAQFRRPDNLGLTEDTFELTKTEKLVAGDYVEVQYKLSGSAPSSGDFNFKGTSVGTVFSIARVR